MKKFLLCLLVLLFAAMPVASAATLYAVIDTPYQSGCCNVRVGPAYYYKYIDNAYWGDEIQILSLGEEWSKVRLVEKGIVGYVKNTYISDPISVIDVSCWGSVDYTVAQRNEGNTLEIAQGKRLAVTGILAETDKEGAIGHVGSWYEVQLIPTSRTGNSYKVYLADGIPARLTGTVNLRKQDNYTATVLKCPEIGTDITVLKIGKSWSKVKVGKITGYVKNCYIDFYGMEEFDTAVAE